MNDEYIQNILINGTRTVVSEEPVPGMTRPLIVHYEFNGEVVVETITYANPPDDAGWAAIETINHVLQQGQGYKTIEL